MSVASYIYIYTHIHSCVDIYNIGTPELSFCLCSTEPDIKTAGDDCDACDPGHRGLAI